MKTKTNKIRKFIAELGLVVIICSFFLMVSSSVLAAGADDAAVGGATNTSSAGTAGGGQTTTTTTPTTTTPSSTIPPGSDKEDYIYIPLDTGAYEDFPHLTQTTPTGMLYEFTNGLIRNLKYILGAFAVLFIAISATKLIIAGDSEDVVTKQKNAILYGIIGLIVIAMGDEFARVLSVACAPGETQCAQGGFLKDPNNMIAQAALFKQATRVLITFIKYLIGGIAVLMLVRNGIRLTALQGNEESVGLDKKNLVWISVGLVLIILASTFIDKVLFIVDPGKYSTLTGVEPALNVPKGIQELVGITNWAVLFVAPIGILMFVVGALMYATAGGNEEQTNKAKRLIILAIAGMALVYGAFAIISTIVAGQFLP